MIAGQPRVVALIPARSGSKRINNKNARPLAGHPLMAYSIAAARASGVFDAVIVSTESEEFASIARHYGAEVPLLRPADLAGDRSPDIDWVEHILNWLRGHGRSYDCFSLLRPTSPFRMPDTIQRAWAQFLREEGVDSLRAIESCTQHPGKMWVVRGQRMSPLLPFGPPEQPWHSSQYASLPAIYVQNASLEIAWTRVVFTGRTIAGEVLTPFFTREHEGFDINNQFDWILAEHLIATGAARLPPIDVPSYRNVQEVS